MNTALQLMMDKLNHEVENLDVGEKPVELYDPIYYILKLGGKRLRPLLSLVSYSLFREDWERILKPALAVEVFHNFTLMHDDIMDRAPLRRGKSTVHEKWNDNIAILSGDVMFVKTYDLLLNIEAEKLPLALSKFNQCATEVCEGQQLDMNFEDRSEVSEAEYLHMIRLKTAVLLGFSLELGALLAGADKESCQALYDFGVNIGVGFQLKDDLLDVYADQNKFGKQLGGDIIANKKTFLLIEALEKAEGEQKEALDYWLSQRDFDNTEKVKAVTTIYDKLGVKETTESKMNTFFELGFECLDQLKVPREKVAVLKSFAQDLINREK
ncbi:polyprenyl synthetase family protein [Xanthovirga aplysinae]|uniref:polyprenyl synthetase family protein n=1 Tax=Xanthovirga aplysinae TaxID=2529853 RepID=UPI0012BBE379|nr:polyprenyl synthetase family protein [Xanthovirga aplysinae]MTI31382.1 polyprenyl synthetase family protein [Xanthovirga aplysinae]